MPRPAKWGVWLSLLLAVWTAVIHLSGIYTTRLEYAKVADQLALVLPLIVVTLALLEERRLRHGQLHFFRAVGLGTAVCAVAAPFTVGVLWVYHRFVNPQWLDLLVRYEVERLTRLGRSTSDIAAAVDRLRQSGTTTNQILGGLVGTVLMGIVVSALVAMAMRVGARLAGAAGSPRTPA